MKIKPLVLSTLLTLTLPAISFADKPDWAGEGGKPSDREKQEHKEDMTSKHEDKKDKGNKKDKDKKNKHDKDQDWDDIEDDVRDKVADEVDRKIRGD